MLSKHPAAPEGAGRQDPEALSRGAASGENRRLHDPAGDVLVRPRLVLASTSPHRHKLLDRLGLAFDVAAPDVDETPLPGEAPDAIALRLAGAKAAAVADRLGEGRALVIGSDQVADLDGRPLGKPGTPERCVDQLLACSGRTVRFHTGLALTDTASGETRALVEPFAVRFRTLDRTAVERYVAVEAPLDAAGGFYVEGLGIVLFEALDGRDPNALVGLPLIALVDLLADAGVYPLAGP
jgi:septum formation protein